MTQQDSNCINFYVEYVDKNGNTHHAIQMYDDLNKCVTTFQDYI